MRRVDPSQRSLGRYFHDEIATPLGLDFWVGAPASLPAERFAPLRPPGLWKRLTGMPVPLVVAGLKRRSVLHRSLVANPGTSFYVEDGVVVRDLEVPSGGGVGSARAIAAAYGDFADAGRRLGLRAETLAALAAPAVPSRHGFFDKCLRGEVQFSLGFMKPSDEFPFGGPSAFGAPGAGGSMGYADPDRGVGYGYVTNRMGVELHGDTRDVALRAALDEALRSQA